MAELTVRQYEPTDRERVLELNEVALRKVGAYADDPEVVEEVLGEGAESFDEDLYDIEGEYLDAGGAFVVGLLDDEIVAMGALGREDDTTARVTKMRVAPDHQRQGFGQRILDELEARAHDLGYTELVLDTTARQTAAQGLYESNGYKQFDEAQFGEYDVLFYRKDLDD